MLMCDPQWGDTPLAASISTPRAHSRGDSWANWELDNSTPLGGGGGRGLRPTSGPHPVGPLLMSRGFRALPLTSRYAFFVSFLYHS